MKQDIKVAVDAVVFGYEAEQGVSVLLIKRKLEPFKGLWALPGGFLKNGESPEDAVSRELKEETGIVVKYLEQLYTFGDPDRDPRFQVVSVTYFALVRPRNAKIMAQSDADDVTWFNIKQLPRLAFDHKKIFQMALKRLRGKLRYEPVGFELLDKDFPFSDLEKLYSTILDRDIDRRNFKKKITYLGLIEKSAGTIKRTTGRPGSLYHFNRDRYFELKKNGYEVDMFF